MQSSQRRFLIPSTVSTWMGAATSPKTSGSRFSGLTQRVPQRCKPAKPRPSCEGQLEYRGAYPVQQQFQSPEILSRGQRLKHSAAESILCIKNPNMRCCETAGGACEAPPGYHVARERLGDAGMMVRFRSGRSSPSVSSSRWISSARTPTCSSPSASRSRHRRARARAARVK